MPGDIAHDGFNHDHALRSSKTTKGGVALGVGFAAVGGNRNVLQKVGVVAVKNSPVSDRARQICTKSAVGGHLQLQSGEPAGAIKAGGVFVSERMAFARHHEVIIAVQAQLDGRFEFVRRDCSPDRKVAGLRFFATKAATHAPALYADRMVVQSQRVGDPVLDFARVLRATVNRPLVLFVGNGISNLPFQIKMLLAADFKCARECVLCSFQCFLRMAPVHKNGRQHIAFRLQCISNSQNGGQGFNV